MLLNKIEKSESKVGLPFCLANSVSLVEIEYIFCLVEACFKSDTHTHNLMRFL